MDDSRRSIATNEESITMYLSFDADDTLASAGVSVSKWQSAANIQTSQDIQLDKTLDDKDAKRKILKELNHPKNDSDQASPLRPFDMSLLTKHNALSSTPSKIAPTAGIRSGNAENKENSQPDNEDAVGAEDNSTLSSSEDVTASTVKTNTLMIDATIDEASVQELNKTNGNNVYPLSADVILQNITEVSNEETSILVDSIPAEKEKPHVAEVVNEVSELIARALKISGDTVKAPHEVHKKRVSLLPKVSSLPLPRPRRSYLPPSSGETRSYSFKQRMSVVVKTTLNSPARKLSSGSALAMASRRSCLPTSKPKASISRKSVAPVASCQNSKSSLPAPVAAKPQPTFNCKTCGAPFRVKHLLDMHERQHDLVNNGANTLKRLNSNASSGSASGSAGNRCKYCDKNFALERALHIHLMQNCAKIPPVEKRKLEFTELNHVKKAQLPKLGAAATGGPKVASVEKASSSARGQMAPPSVKKVPKNVAHAGVYRTPTKTVPCHICKQSFKSILEYTEHSLAKHSKAKNQKTQDSAEAASAKD